MVISRHVSCVRLGVLSAALLAGAVPATAQVPAVMYHAYESSTYYNRDNFRDHLDYFVANSFRTITLDQFYEWRVNDGILPYRPILLTVDDNYSLGYTEIYPALAARKMVATNYTHTLGIGIGIPKALWPQVAEMDAAGVFLVESHSQTHPNLTTISGTQLRQEVVGSRADIAANVGGKVSNHFAYPSGIYNATVIAELQAAGYKTGMTTKTGLNYRTTPLFELQRYGGDGRTLTQFLQSSGLGTLPPAPPGPGWILDDADPAALPKGTSWTTTSGSVAYQGKHLVATGGTAATVRFAALLPEAGTMRIHARWAAASDRAAAATYTIQAADGSHAVSVDQRAQGGQWVTLGDYSFAPGQPAMVTLGGTGGTLSADAVWFEPLATPAAPQALAIDVAAGTMTQREAGRGWIGTEWSALRKTGAGTLVLDRGNALAGPVSVAAGALMLTDTAALGAASRIDVLAGATLDVTGLSGGYQAPSGQVVGGAGTIAGSVVFGRGVTLAPGAAATSTPLGSLAIASVPEPSGAALAALGVAVATSLAVGWRRRARGRRRNLDSAHYRIQLNTDSRRRHG